MLLVGGLLLEVAEAVKSDKKVGSANLEAQQAQNDAGLANERASIIESNNLILLLELKRLKNPRAITAQQINDFIFLTEEIKKLPVEIQASGGNDEAFSYAMQIRNMFNQAHFGIAAKDKDTNNSAYGVFILKNIMDIFPISPFTNIINWPDVDFFYNSPRDIREYTFGYDYTNQYARPYILTNDVDETNKTLAAIAFILQEIGFTNVFSGNVREVPSGILEIRVLPKPQ